MIMKSRIQVENILKEYPEARNNDFYLCWIWLQKEYGIELPELTYSQYKELNGKFSTLTRWRRKIQGAGEYMPDYHKDNRRVGGKYYKERYNRTTAVPIETKKPTTVEKEIKKQEKGWSSGKLTANRRNRRPV